MHLIMCSLHQLSLLTHKKTRHDYMHPALLPICAVEFCDAPVVERDDQFDYLISQLVEHIEHMMSHSTDTSLSLLTNVFLTAMDKDEVYRWVVDDMWRRVETNQDLLGTSACNTREQHCMDRMRNFRDFLESHCTARSYVNMK